MTVGNMGGTKRFGLDLSHKAQAFNHAHHLANKVAGGPVLSNINVDFHVVVREVVPRKMVEKLQKFLGDLERQEGLMIDNIANALDTFKMHSPPEVSSSETNTVDDESGHKCPDGRFFLNIP